MVTSSKAVYEHHFMLQQQTQQCGMGPASAFTILPSIFHAIKPYKGIFLTSQD